MPSSYVAYAPASGRMHYLIIMQNCGLPSLAW